jgi:hypothetical protein
MRNSGARRRFHKGKKLIFSFTWHWLCNIFQVQGLRYLRHGKGEGEGVRAPPGVEMASSWGFLRLSLTDTSNPKMRSLKATIAAKIVSNVTLTSDIHSSLQHPDDA